MTQQGGIRCTAQPPYMLMKLMSEADEARDLGGMLYEGLMWADVGSPWPICRAILRLPKGDRRLETGWRNICVL